MTNDSPRPSIATVFDPALQISSVDRTSQIMYCPDKQVLAWFVTTPCAMHPDGERRIVDARGWQCTSCGRYLGEWMFTKADFESALAHIVSRPEVILFEPVRLNAWIRMVRQRERVVALPRLLRVGSRAMTDLLDDSVLPRQTALSLPVDNCPAAGPLSRLSTTAGDEGRGIRQFFGLKVLHHRWRRALEFIGFRR